MPSASERAAKTLYGREEEGKRQWCHMTPPCLLSVLERAVERLYIGEEEGRSVEGRWSKTKMTTAKGRRREAIMSRHLDRFG